MFRAMRKNEQAMSRAACEAVLDRATAGVLAVTGDAGYPYAVPLSFVRAGPCLLFHGAARGHKLDAIAQNDKVSFCVIDADHVVAEAFTTHFRSVIVFGRARMLTQAAEKLRAMQLLVEKYAPRKTDEVDRAFAGAGDKLVVVEMTIEHMTGKESPELARLRPSR